MVSKLSQPRDSKNNPFTFVEADILLLNLTNFNDVLTMFKITTKESLYKDMLCCVLV